MWSDLLYRIRTILRRSAVETELDEELRFHFENEMEKYMKAGMPREEAARRARLAFGGLEQVKEETRDTRGISALEKAARDLRYGIRVLRKSPAFALVAVVSLALGIGANTAIFQLMDAVRLRTLPVRSPHELAEVRIADMTGARGNFNKYPALTNPIWEQIRSRQQPFSGIFAWSDGSFDISSSGEAVPVRGLWVSGDFFPVLGIHPVLGRLFTGVDDRRGCGLPGAVISYAFWQRQFGGGDLSAIGRKLTLNGYPVEIIGITPESFFGLEVGRRFDVAVPICAEAALRGKNSRLDSGTTWWLTVMGRLKPGMTVQGTAAYFAAISPGIFQASLPAGYPQVNVKHYLGFKLNALPAATGLSDLRDRYSDPLRLLLAIAALVLLIACGNVANLMLARGSARARDIALRLAIGASRGDLIRQWMTESLLIATAGATLGLLLAAELSRWLVLLLSTQGDSLFVDLHPDWRVLVFTAGLAILTCIVFGLTPALRATRGAPGDVLKTGGRGMTSGRERFGLRRFLVASQVAFSLVLLVGALLFLRSLLNLTRLEAGFQQDGILIANVSWRRLNLPPERIPPRRRDLIERLRAIPGVISAADATVIPVSGSTSGNTMWMDGSRPSQGIGINRSRIGTGYFQTLGTPLLTGRDFDVRDTATSPKVAIVNEAFAGKLLGGANPLSKRFWIEATPTDPEMLFTIVGLVRNTKYASLREDFQPVVFLPMSQDPRPGADPQILIRSNASLETPIGSVRRTLVEADPKINFTFQVFKTQIRDSLLRERLMAILSSAFGLLAGLLAAIGLYGVIAYMIVQRQHEIGVRMALGAKRRDILTMILREGGMLVGIGLLTGTILSLIAGRAASALLFGLQPSDPVTHAAAAAALAVVALAASYVPARPAAGLDPMIALRDE